MKVLVVDDDERIIEMIKAALEDKGIEVISASNGLEGIEKAKKENPDLILMDIKMPVVDGLEALENLKQDQKTKNIPTVMLTGDLQSADIERAHNIGIDSYITKPFDPKRLAFILKEKLARHKK